MITFQISCFDWDSDGSHDFIGTFTTNLREMCSIQQPREVQFFTVIFQLYCAPRKVIAQNMLVKFLLKKRDVASKIVFQVNLFAT